MECPFCQGQIGSYSTQCKKCGKLIPPGQYLLEESGVIEPSPPLTFAADSVAGSQDPYRFARLGDRFIAFVLDSAFLFGLFSVVDACAFMRWGSVEGTELQLTAASLLVAITSNAALLFLYGWLLEATWGATLGKAIVGIRVVGTSRRGSLSACAVRNVLRIVDGMGFYLVGIFVASCSAVRQRLGDIYAQTAVIEESFGISLRIAAMVLWIASLATAAWTLPRICRAEHFVRPRYLGQVIIQVGRKENSAYFRLGRFAVNVQLASAARDANQ
jgi:uncharacterized RDD family membrane protein YckC